MILTVGANVYSGWEFFNLDFESLLDIFENLDILSAAHECNSETFGSESSSSSDSVKVGVWILWHIKVENNVDLFNIDTSSKDVGWDHDSVLEALEIIVSLDSKNSDIFT